MMKAKRWLWLCWIIAISMPTVAAAQGFPAWTALLRAHVVAIHDGTASQVDYAALKRHPGRLDAVTRALSDVSAKQYAGWTKARREAFLINAYNAFTVKLIVAHYPHIDSIKDIGGWFSSPWKLDFFTLLGRKTNLDAIEARLRKPGNFDDPRIHFAINCASIGCPMLRREAYTADKLDAQLDDQVRRFLSDHHRNRYANDRLEISKIFDWYAADFTHGWHGITSVKQFLAAHAADLTTHQAAQARIRAQKVPVDYLDYDWRLNAVTKP